MNLFKRILAIIGLCLAFGAAVAYFVFAAWLDHQHAHKQVCQRIEVVITDSLDYGFIQKKDVLGRLLSLPEPVIGQSVGAIDLHQIEQMLEQQGAIHVANASVNRSGILTVSISQRNPIVRIMTGQGSFYVDQSNFFFPWSNQFTAYVPVVSGHIPLHLEKDFRGKVSGQDAEWTNQLLELVHYISQRPFWRSQIQQIHVEENGELLLFTRVGDQLIRFGTMENLDTKFRKLSTFYDQIVPVEGWNQYAEVDLRFRNQIVCTKKEQKKK